MNQLSEEKMDDGMDGKQKSCPNGANCSRTDANHFATLQHPVANLHFARSLELTFSGDLATGGFVPGL